MGDVGNIYVISSPFWKDNFYKIGKHTGDQAKLKKRYRTAMGNITIHYFYETSNVSAVEKEIFKDLSQYRQDGIVKKSEVISGISLKEIHRIVLEKIKILGNRDYSITNKEDRTCTIL